jgi:hypothetical protein
MDDRKTGRGPPSGYQFTELASFASYSPPQLAEPSLDGVDPAGVSDASAQIYLMGLEARQGSLLAASGTLTQFNAIMAAILGAVISSATYDLLKITAAVALVAHVLAAFMLCWSASVPTLTLGTRR